MQAAMLTQLLQNLIGLKVAVDYEGDNNDETRDAFFKAETFKVTGNTEIDVVLEASFCSNQCGCNRS